MPLGLLGCALDRARRRLAGARRAALPYRHCQMTAVHPGAARCAQALAPRAPRACGNSHEPAGSSGASRCIASTLGAPLHPVLQRAYAARGVLSATDFGCLGRKASLPVGTLAGVAESGDAVAGAPRNGPGARDRGTSMPMAPRAPPLMVRAMRAWVIRRGRLLVPNRFRVRLRPSHRKFVALAKTTRADAHRDGRQRWISSVAGVGGGARRTHRRA